MVAAAAALVSMFLTPPCPAYLGYVDTTVLIQLFCLMAVVAGLEQSGVLVLPNDAPEALIVQTIRLLAAVRIQLEQMQHKTEKLEAKVADIRIINRAKLLLVQHLQMTETEAHKYIEKQAMNTSKPRRTIAENIIRTYED